MKTSKQTKRAISVGLINSACVVIVAAATLFCGVTAARADEPDNRIDWRRGRPGVMVVTNAPTAVAVTNIATTVATEVAGGVAENLFGPRVTALEGGTNNWNTAYSWGNHAGLYRAIGWVPSWGDLTDIPQDFPPSTHEHDYTTITNPPWLTSFTETDEIALSHITIIEGGTNNWNTAYSWGDHAGLYKGIGWFPSWTEVTDKPATFPPETHQHDYTAITNPPWLEEYTETDEVALAALAAHSAYWPPDATASSWFTFTTNSGAITITDYNIDGGTAVIIPDYINGWPVTTIGENAFYGSAVTSFSGRSVLTIGGAVFVNCVSLTAISLPDATAVGGAAFAGCVALTSVNMPNATAIGNSTQFGGNIFDGCVSLISVTIPHATLIGRQVFKGCTALTSVYFDGNAPTIGTAIFDGITPNQVTVYVTNPQATGWGATWGGMPVVRLDLHGREIYKDGLPVATEAHVAEQIAGKVDAVSGLASNLWLQGNTIVSDSYTNLLWRNVYSNGWHWLVAYTNAPGGGE